MFADTPAARTQLGGHGGNEASWNASAEAIIAVTALLIASEPKGVNPLSRNMFNVDRALGTYGKQRTAAQPSHSALGSSNVTDGLSLGGSGAG